MKRIIVISLCLLIVVGILGVVWVVRVHGLSAREEPLAVEAWIARHVRRLAIPANASSMKNPHTPSTLSIAEARDHFADHCAICHGNDGAGKTIIAEGLYPPVPDLRAKESQTLSDGELFYIIKNGVRFTGMPGWGGEDEENWKLVNFIRHLPDLSPTEKSLMNELNHLDD